MKQCICMDYCKCKFKVSMSKRLLNIIGYGKVVINPLYKRDGDRKNKKYIQWIVWENVFVLYFVVF